MVWIPEYDIFFIPIPRAGTQSVKRVLGQNFGSANRKAGLFVHPCYLDAEMITRNHPNPVKMFATVRNPEYRIMSAIRCAYQNIQGVPEVIEPMDYVDRVINKILKRNTVSPFVPVSVADDSLYGRDQWENRWRVDKKVTLKSAFGLTSQSWYLEGAKGNGVHVFALEHFDEMSEWVGATTKTPWVNESSNLIGYMEIKSHPKWNDVLDRYDEDFKLYEDALSRNLRPL